MEYNTESSVFIMRVSAEAKYVWPTDLILSWYNDVI